MVNAHTPSQHPDGQFAVQAAAMFIGAIGGVAVQAAMDVYHGEVSSLADYAGAAVGGAAGGLAATTCGPACAGAVAGAAGNIAKQAVNALQGKDVSVGDLVVDTAVGAVGGKVIGSVLPKVAKAAIPNNIKGKIGEGLSKLGLKLTGQGIAGRNVSNKVGKSNFDFKLKSGKFVESKFGTAKLSRPQRTAAKSLGDKLEVHEWTYDKVSGMATSGLAGPGLASENMPKSSSQ